MVSQVLDHIWQSTILALGLGLMTLMFQKAAAGVRYGLWLAASLKFLVPFAALAALGRLLAPAIRLPQPAAPQAVLIERAVRPFSQGALPRITPPAPPILQATASSAPLTQAHAAVPAIHAAPHLDLAVILLGAWVLGAAVVAIAWARRWVELSKVVRSARPLPWPATMPVLAAASLVEPGLVGLWRPVLLVPETLTEHLSPVEVAAIVAHEACHLRRKDNLTAALHMLVEALFWFHPLVWWIGGRLIAERERACDEAVITAGHDRATYARSLLESCRLYLQSPLDCVAGASGSNLKTRVETIMTAPMVSPLSLSRKVLLAAAGALTFATPVTAGLLTSPEGQNALARAGALASSLSPRDGRASAAASSGVETAPNVALSRETPVLTAPLAVASLDAAPAALTQDLAAPRIDAPAAPVQLAAAAPAPAIQPKTPPADPKQEAVSFVESYAASTRSGVAARWSNPICVRVVGLPSEQAAAVKARVEQVAKGAGLGNASEGKASVPAVVTGSRIGRTSGQNADCKVANVEIGFTTDPQAMLDSVAKRRTHALGDGTSDTRNVKTVTLPIQAWYMTNGVEMARNSVHPDGAGRRGDQGLKVDVVWQSAMPDGAGSFGQGPGAGYMAPGASAAGASGGDFGIGFPGVSALGLPNDFHRNFQNVFVIVDVKKVDGNNLGLISDYVSMLVLSEPRALGQCNVVPSVTDLFASCPGRAAPDGLTPADAAYLTALYDAKGKSQKTAEIAKRMASILGSEGARAEAAPAPAPVRPIRPASAVAPAANPSRPALTPVASGPRPADAQPGVSPFVQSFSGKLWNSDDPICIRVEGAEPAKTARVKARVEAVARAAGVGVQRACGLNAHNVEIRFSVDAERDLHDALAGGGRTQPWPFPLERPQGADRPIRAWYQLTWDAAGAGGFDSAWQPGAQTGVPLAPPNDPRRTRKLGLAVVVIDPRRTQSLSLDAVSDYAALLALSQPRTLDSCNALPSVTDLFAGACPGRAPAAGLTDADAAYLKALYTGSPGIRASRSPSELYDRMARLLAPARLAAR